jgi:photosystem II stability/assembly factor-like uncharacterized protein
MTRPATPSLAGACSTLLALAALTGTPLLAQTSPASFPALRYRSIGPTQGGRVTAVAGVAQQPGTFYMGASGGGVWKSTDYGQHWTNVSDGFFATGSIGAIRAAPTNPDRVYVGTGSDGIRSNVILGKGVYRSDDAGKTWRHIGLGTVGQIGAVEIHPRNPDVVFVAAIGSPFGPGRDRGVYRTRDGGASWEQALFISDSTGAVDLEFAPDNPDEIYAAMWRVERKPWTIISGAREGGIWKSTDGGTTWKQLTGGLPAGLVGKADLAVSPADPNRLYVLIEALPGGGLYRSDDRGASFRLVSEESGLLRRPFYYTGVEADPTNADVLYVNNESFFKSLDGGKTWSRRTTPHGDNHDIWIDPADPRVMIQSNDGGANVTRDGGNTWSTQDNQPTAEVYQVAMDDRFPAWAYAGQQDNGTAIAVPMLPPFDDPAAPEALWINVGGCETGPAVPKPGDPAIIYTNCKGQFGVLNLRTGQEQHYWVGGQNLYGANPRDLTYRFQRVVPVHVSPYDPNTVYHGSQYLHRTRDGGVTWERISPDLTANEPDKQVYSGTPITRDITGEEHYSTLYSVRESPVQRGVIWTGANDGPVHVTRDGGKTWNKVTPPDLLPGGRVQNIEPSPHQAGKAYIAVYRYLLNDWQPYIYRTTDYGRSWTRLTTGRNGIPADFPTRVVREDPVREGLLYAGTEFGMFLSFDDGATWRPMQLNLPVTPVTDIAVHGDDLVLSTMGRGFYVLDDVTPLRSMNPAGMAGPSLFAPAAAIRMWYRATAAGTSPEYPPSSAVIDYVVAPGTTDPAVLQILDRNGTVLRSFTSATPPRAQAAPVQGMRGPPSGVPAEARLTNEPGMQRFRWDLRLPGPQEASGQTAGRGPVVAPDTYQVRLTIGAWSSTQPLTVRADPRVTAEGITDAMLTEQMALAVRIRDAITEARKTAARVRTLKASATGAGAATLAEVETEFFTASGPYPTPMLLDQLNYLASMLEGADQRPGRDAYERLDELTRWHAALVAKLRTVPGWQE